MLSSSVPKSLPLETLPATLHPVLGPIAEDLAKQFGYDPFAAEAAEIDWYQDRLGESLYTPYYGVLLHDLTVIRCCEHERRTNLAEVDEFEVPPPILIAVLGVSVLGVVLGIVIALFWLVLILTGHAPVPATPHAAAAIRGVA